MPSLICVRKISRAETQRRREGEEEKKRIALVTLTTFFTLRLCASARASSPQVATASDMISPKDTSRKDAKAQRRRRGEEEKRIALVTLTNARSSLCASGVPGQAWPV
jgi:hypothetical protein